MKRKTIGRTLTSSLTSLSESDELSYKDVILASGKKVTFTRTTIPYEIIKEKTFIREEINGREQSSLTPESLKNITDTLSVQQFFPIVGVYRDERIEILDGSRRRAAALLIKKPLDAIVTSDDISIQDAHQLVKDIQTAKEYSLREVGLRLKCLLKSGLTQKEIAKQEGLSESKVTRALQAANISTPLISIIPFQSELSFSDYNVLLNIDNKLKELQYSVNEFVLMVKNDIDAIKLKGLPPDENKKLIISALRKYSDDFFEENKSKPLITPLWTFGDKNKFARKKQSARRFCYEFNRLPVELQHELDQAISQILHKHLK